MTIIEEAESIIDGPRRDAYGPVEDSFRRHGLLWTALLLHKLKPGCEITPEDAALMMVGLKLNREANMHGRDNLVDMHGYLMLLEKLINGKPDGQNSDKS